jgi:hypothetical protein
MTTAQKDFYVCSEFRVMKLLDRKDLYNEKFLAELHCLIDD